MNDRRKSLVHILRCTEFLNLGESAVDLVAHGRNHVVNGDHVLLVEQGLSPDLGVDFVALLEVGRDVISSFRNLAQLLRSVDVQSCLGHF